MYETIVGDRPISFSPASKIEEIQQNLMSILTTVKGSVPYDRSFGIGMTALDQPAEVAIALISAEAIEAIEQYESRVVVQSVTTTYNENGHLVPLVKWELAEEVSI